MAQGTPLDAATISKLLKLGWIAPGPAGYRFTPSPEELANRPSPQAKYGDGDYTKMGPYMDYDSYATHDGKIFQWDYKNRAWMQAL